MLEYLESLGMPEAGQYIEEFRGELFVIKCGGSLLENPETGGSVLDDIACLRRCGIRPVLVHGGSVQANREMEEAGIEPKRYRGLRITCDRTICILERCFGQLNCELVDALEGRGVQAAGFSGARGGLVLGEKMELDGVDLGWVGDVRGVARDVWESIGADCVPVVASLGVGPGGETLNINADYVATRLAELTGARKLILMTDVDGVCLDPNNASTLVSTLDTERARELIRNGSIAGGMVPKIESAVRAIGNGLRKVHMINGRRPHSLLLEIFTSEGVGTQIIRG